MRLEFLSVNYTVVSPAESVQDMGHLDGWGQGLHHGISIFMPWTRGNVSEKTVTLVVKGSGDLRVKVGSCRVGWQSVVVAVD